MELGEDEAAFVKTLDLLSYKPIIYVANVSDEDIASGDNRYVSQVRSIAAGENAEVAVICAEIEAESASWITRTSGIRAISSCV